MSKHLEVKFEESFPKYIILWNPYILFKYSYCAEYFILI